MDSIIYSDPFKTEKNFDHQYRATINEINFELDHVKCNEEEGLDECVVLVKNIVKLPINEAKIKIKSSIDIRTNEKMIDDGKTEEEKLSYHCLNELYEYLIDNIFN